MTGLGAKGRRAYLRFVVALSILVIIVIHCEIGLFTLFRPIVKINNAVKMEKLLYTLKEMVVMLVNV
jgi:hypothetical protein